MKLRFNTYDIVCGVTELQTLIGLRVNQIYDIDNKTYLIRLQGGGEQKKVLLIESGIRFHTTAFEWPKNVAPSGFSMKLRKHLKNKRLEKLQQLGVDRIVDLQFGTDEVAHHIIVELYDRGNIILTDHDFTILYILRAHQEGEDVRFAVREKYPLDRAKQSNGLLSESDLRDIINKAESGDNLRRALMPFIDCGPTVLEHVLIKHKLADCTIPPKPDQEEDNNKNDVDVKSVKFTEEKKTSKKKNRQDKKKNVLMRSFEADKDIEPLMKAIQECYQMMENARSIASKGYIIQKKEVAPQNDKFLYQNIEYQPYMFQQFENEPVQIFDSFMLAVDEFYSTLEGQKIDMKTLQQEREALKKLTNVKKDHAKRLEELTKVQEVDKQKAELITCNQELVDKAILAIRSALANQMSWPDIHELVKAAQANRDVVAQSIKQLKLEINHITLKLSDPYATASCNDASGGGQTDSQTTKENGIMLVDVDLALTAYANARKYYDMKRSAAQKEQKTIDASQKALKSAERKTQQTLKEVRTISSISKVRKVYWFEKFFWFISSENYLVIGGRDAQQNELIVKRYMRPTDIYVHAEIQGASSVIVRNPTGEEVPPKTLLEAGTMAISYSVAWEAKVVTNAYWVNSQQVSKTAPSGEYLGTGSFMIRGKKNFLPSCHLVMGISFLFKLEDSFVEKHRGERKVRTFEDDQQREELQNQQQREKKDSAVDGKEFTGEQEDVEIELEHDDDDDNDDENEENDNDADQDVQKEKQKNVVGDDDDNDDDDDDDDDDEHNAADKYPDTQVKIEHDTGKIIINTLNNESKTVAANATNKDVAATKLLTQSKEAEAEVEVEAEAEAVEEEAIIVNSAPPRKKQQQNSKKRKNQQQQQKQMLQQQKSEEASKNTAQHRLKRGQRSKLKKIKAKYKDQDEEERQLRMQILKSAGNIKNTIEAESQQPKPIKKKQTATKTTETKGPAAAIKKQSNLKENAKSATDLATIVEGEILEDHDDINTGADVEMLDTLTGQPFDTDELLFCIPVVAPYQALQAYKYKVKLTPGTGKRGRAAKTALAMFCKDKQCTSREKDLFKSIKEEAMARNIPGKVKLSAPHLQKYHK